MVKLGFIKDETQRPPGYLRVCLKPCGPDAAQDVSTSVASWPGEEGEQVFELTLEVKKGMEHMVSWVETMARIIQDMGWKNWTLDTNSISMILDRYITEALKTWGLEFFKHYQTRGVILLKVGLQREAVAHSVLAWEEAFKSVRFSNDHDFETMEREMETTRKKPGLFKSLLRPKSFASKQRA